MVFEHVWLHVSCLSPFLFYKLSYLLRSLALAFAVDLLFSCCSATSLLVLLAIILDRIGCKYVRGSTMLQKANFSTYLVVSMHWILPLLDVV